jgi:uncharacterized ferredoxin-like protein
LRDFISIANAAFQTTGKTLEQIDILFAKEEVKEAWAARMEELEYDGGKEMIEKIERV